MNLYEIKDPSFLKQLNKKELESLASDIRSFLIEKISKTGGHLASNLGVVELTLGLHYVFDSPKDSIIFDVSHQSYTHKILTGRAKDFDMLRQQKGLSGYASYDESIHDKWESGHAGTSISAMTGYLYAQKRTGHEGHVISVVGDASIMNGTNMEALNFLGQEKDKKGIIILNDNNMSISKNVGAFSIFLGKLRGSKLTSGIRKVMHAVTPNFLWRFFRRIKRAIKAIFQTGNMFEDMGYIYLGPIDGNNVKKVIKTLQMAKKLRKNVVIHMVTQKGKGYTFAEQDKEGSYHGVSAFDKDSGLDLAETSQTISWSQGVANIMEKLAISKDLFVIMPAMLVGARFLDFQAKYPERIIDVGIAEEHAAVMAAAMALNKINVFLPLYSTFSQRAYDQILNDIARPNLKVVIGIDRAGFVGDDGATHQGLYDVSMFLSMPNVTVTMPRNLEEAYGLFKYAYMQEGPFVVRYPRGSIEKTILNDTKPIGVSWEQLTNGFDGYVLSYGPILNTIIDKLKEEDLSFSVINARYIRPIDNVLLDSILKTGKPIVVYEQTHSSGSLYQMVLDYAAQFDYQNPIKSLNVYNKVIQQGSVLDNMIEAGVSMEDLVRLLKSL